MQNNCNIYSLSIPHSSIPLYLEKQRCQQKVVFDVTQFVGLLDGFPGVHQFKLTVEDVNGEKAEATLTIDSSNAQ